MADRIRMHLDENVDPDVARALRRHGIIYCSKTARTVGEMIPSLILIYEVLAPDDMRSKAEFV